MGCTRPCSTVYRLRREMAGSAPRDRFHRVPRFGRVAESRGTGILPGVKLQLTYYGDPVLREPSRVVSAVTDRHRELADSMLALMREANGVGLAAQQVGRTEALCVVDVPPEADLAPDGGPLNPDAAMPLVLFNPEVIAASEEIISSEEGCLSFPGIYAPIERHAEVDVRFLDRAGTERTLHLKGLAGRAVQHEIDHLRGVLICDRMSPVKKVALSGRLKRLRKETAARAVIR
jgi:peptide deformylase